MSMQAPPICKKPGAHPPPCPPLPAAAAPAPAAVGPEPAAPCPAFRLPAEPASEEDGGGFMSGGPQTASSLRGCCASRLSALADNSRVQRLQSSQLAAACTHASWIISLA